MTGYFVHCYTEKNEWCIFTPEMKLDVLSYRFLLFKKDEGISSNTLRQYAYAVKTLYDFLRTNGLLLKNFGLSDLSDFRTWYINVKNRKTDSSILLSHKDKVSHSTINNMLYSLRAFFSYLEKMGIGSGTKTSDFKMKRSKQLSSEIDKLKAKKDTEELLKHIAIDEYSSISSCLNKRDVLIADTLYTTGMRLGELFSLTIDMFSAKTKTDVVMLDVFESSSEERNRQTKTGHRVVFVPIAIYNRIIKYITYGRRKPNHKFIFVTIKNTKSGNKGDALNPDTFRQNFKRACRKNGLDYTPHDLRHTFATNIYRKTGDLKFAQSLLGHKNIDTTIKYTHSDDKDTAARLSKIQREMYPELLGGM